jgi:two-component system chemotaxis response regulator CheB
MRDVDGPIRVLVVDDSPLVRQVLGRLLEADPAVRVIGYAGDGKEAVEKTFQLRPDLITMDIRMPGMDGLQATEKIMAYRPTPILIVTSARDRRGVQVTMEALAAGALEVVEKPTLMPDDSWEALGAPLVEKVKLLAGVKVITHLKGRSTLRAGRARPEEREKPQRVVGIGVSTGGPGVLATILGALPLDFPLGLLIVQHITEGFMAGLVEWLGRQVRLPIRIAREGDPVRPGLALMAPEGVHLIVERGGRAHLRRALPVGGHRPSADVLLHSLAEVYGEAAVGVLLTGMGRDGAEGLQAVRNAGGCTIVQDEESCAVFGMPKAAIELGAAQSILPPGGIAERLIQLAYRPVP